MTPSTINEYSSSGDFLKKATGVATYYGFMPFEDIFEGIKKTRARKYAIGYSARDKKLDSFDGDLTEIVRACVSNKLHTLPEPILFYHSNIPKTGPIPDPIRFGLQVVGSKKTIAEALVLKVALAILGDLGLKDAKVCLNSMGDKDSAIKYSKEVHGILRKNIETLPAHGRAALKKDVFSALDFINKKDHPLKEELPGTLEFLSEGSRKHLHEVIEYLEMVGIPYELNHQLIGHKDCFSQTLFEINNPNEKTEENQITLARGGRYDELSKKMYRVTLPAVGIILECKKTKTQRKDLEIKPKKIRRPKIYFIQLGFDAKLKSLPVIEMLRQEKIPLYQSLGKDKLSGQLSLAEKLDIPYTIIMGQKEAVDGTVIVRNMNTRAQSTVPVTNLPDYLKTIV